MDEIAIEQLQCSSPLQEVRKISHLGKCLDLEDNTASASKSPFAELSLHGDGLGEVMAASPPRSKLQLAAIMSMLYSSVFLAAVDTTITSTALPTISNYFNSSAGYTWIGSAYLLGTAASMPSLGKISDIFGRKPALLMSLASFFLGSLICGVATSMSMLITGRAIQGIGGGGIVVMVNVVTSDLFSIRNRSLIFGFESLIWATATAVGPVLGGAFSEYVNWRWCFYITLPFVGIAFFFSIFFLRLDSPSTPIFVGLKAIDWIGSITIVGVTLTLLLGLEFGGVIFPWDSVKVICLLVFGVVIAVCFLFNEARLAEYPIMPLRLFKSRSNVAALLVCFLHGMTYFTVTYYLPLYGQAVRGYSPLQSGIFVFPFDLTISISAAVSGIIIKVTGRYLELMYIGMSLLVVSMGLFIHFTTIDTPKAIWIIVQIVAGFAAGIMYPSPLISLQAGIQTIDTATATSSLGFIRQLSIAISVVIGGVVFQNGMESQNAKLALDAGANVAAQFTGKQAAANVLLIEGLNQADKTAVRVAFASSLKQMWILFACTAATGLLSSLFIKRRQLNSVHEVVKVGLPAETEAIVLKNRVTDARTVE